MTVQAVHPLWILYSKCLATLAYITFQNIIGKYYKLLNTYLPNQKVDELFVCGLGANNKNIVNHLENSLPDATTKLLQDIRIPGNAKASLRCAQMDLETILRHAIDDIPVNTKEQQHRTSKGLVLEGKGWEDTRKQIVNFYGGQKISSLQCIVEHAQKQYEK